jgi:two-component system sensor histidine kinase/response regulator
VDDHNSIQDLLHYALYQAGFEILTAMSGEEALQRVERDNPRPGVMLIDVKIPGMDGVELARRVAQRWPSMRIVLMSAFISVGVAQLTVWRENIGHCRASYPSNPQGAGAVEARWQEFLADGQGG